MVVNDKIQIRVGAEFAIDREQTLPLNFIIGNEQIDGFKGFNLTGTLPDGSRACLTNVTSKKSNLLVQIEINYFLGDEARVDAILKSLTEGKPKATKEKKEKKEKQKVQKKGAKPKPIKPGKVADDTPTPLYEI